VDRRWMFRVQRASVLQRWAACRCLDPDTAGEPGSTGIRPGRFAYHSGTLGSFAYDSGTPGSFADHSGAVGLPGLRLVFNLTRAWRYEVDGRWLFQVPRDSLLQRREACRCFDAAPGPVWWKSRSGARAGCTAAPCSDPRLLHLGRHALVQETRRLAAARAAASGSTRAGSGQRLLHLGGRALVQEAQRLAAHPFRV
jgi:hypothetical protein